MALHPLKNRKLEVRFAKDTDQPTDTPQEVVIPADYSEVIQDTVRIVSAHVVLGVGTYVILDTFRKVVVKMVPGH